MCLNVKNGKMKAWKLGGAFNAVLSATQRLIFSGALTHLFQDSGHTLPNCPKLSYFANQVTLIMKGFCLSYVLSLY